MEEKLIKKAQIKAVILVMSVLLMVSGCAKEQRNKSNSDRGIFSWKSDALMDENMINNLQKLKINQVYQFISKSTAPEELEEFLTRMSNAKIDVYALYGEREWALDPSGSKMCEMIERVKIINNDLKEKDKEICKIKGIIFDVEPYLLDEWQKDSQNVMESFVKATKCAYETKEDLQIMLCVPYYYDTKGFNNELELLVAECCDGILVMNYYRDKEEKHISDEIKICNIYNKNIYTIYEMKPRDDAQVEDVNTYYSLGIKAVEDNFMSLQKSFSDTNLGIAYHDYKAIKEVIEGE